ncbi:MAG: hypothetical protein EON58_08715 [Alphaproteobacteria bacterium]|nr:MAG: hypothetical protein EON58_08715 [Alphaproteobacteria bacterium]
MNRIPTLLTLVLCTGCLLAANKAVPRDATSLIANVRTAALARDQNSLKLLMATDFVLSFGGDGGKAEALALWTSNPEYLQELAKATSGPCELQLPDYVQCPLNAGSGLRAGFKLVDTKWVFSSFVGGD